MSRPKILGLLVLAMSFSLAGVARANDALCLLPYWPEC